MQLLHSRNILGLTITSTKTCYLLFYSYFTHSSILSKMQPAVHQSVGDVDVPDTHTGAILITFRPLMPSNCPKVNDHVSHTHIMHTIFQLLISVLKYSGLMTHVNTPPNRNPNMSVIPVIIRLVTTGPCSGVQVEKHCTQWAKLV